MAFLTKAELKTVGDIELVDIVVNSDDEIVTTIIDESIALMQSYLSRYYDVDTIFSAEDTDRSLTVVKRLKDIVIYEVYERLSRDTNDVASRRYNEAINWLEKMNTGEFSDHTIPQITSDVETAGTTGIIRFGGDIIHDSNY